MSYTPTVTDGMYPEDAGWTKENNTDVLLLSTPMLSKIIDKKFAKFDYTWLYNKELEAYIFCFRIQNEDEYAIIFHREHAGRLLLEKEAYGEFTLIITDLPFDQLNENSPLLRLPKISLDRQSSAGW